MHTQHTCSFSTFWLGYKSWLTERGRKTLPEVLTEVQSEHGKAFPLKIFWILISLFFFMVVLVALLPAATRHTVDAGLTSNGLANGSGIAAFLLIFSVLGVWGGRTAFRLKRFCREMCDRGHAIQAARAA